MIAIALAVLTPRATEAQDDRARDAFREASVAYDGGQFEEALRLFQEAYDLSDRKTLLYNIGLVSERLQRDEDAVAAYEEFVTAMPNAPQRENVRGRIQVLRTAIAARQANAARIESERAQALAEFEEEAERDQRQAAERARAAALEETRLVYVPPGPAPLYLIAIGAGLSVAGGVMLALGVRSIARVENAQMGTSWSDVDLDHDRGPRFALTGWVLGGAGLATVLTGIIWHFAGGKTVQASQLEPSVTVALGVGSLSLRGSF